MMKQALGATALALASQYGMAIETPFGEEVSRANLFSCMACSASMDAVGGLFSWPFFEEALLTVAEFVCVVFRLADEPVKICPQIVPQMGNQLFPVVSGYLATRDRVCNEWMGWCSAPVYEQIDLNNLVTEMMKTKPMNIRDDNFVNKIYEEIAADKGHRETYIAVHISDPHLDFDYKEGTLANCKSYLCCRESSGYPEKPGDIPAGKWGGYMCDTPRITLQSMLDHVKHAIKPDMFIWTGDNSAHNVWDNTAEEVTAYTVSITEEIKAYFADTDITVLPVQGNHDTWPVDIQNFAEPGINYPINHFKDSWADWLTPDALEQFGKYGYYSMPLTLRNGKKMPRGSRLIAYNSQICDSLNWWLLGQRSDPGHQFAWLTNELEAVEADGGIALLIAHIDPNDCQHQWGVRYRALMERFQNVVRFALQGHTHNEDFQVNMSITHPDKAVGVNSVGGSLTPYTEKNPSFMVIEFDAETMLPVNMKTYSFNLEEANALAGDEPGWEMLHDWVHTYKMKDLSPASMKELSDRFLTDQDLVNTYAWNRGRQYGPKPTEVDSMHYHCNTSTTETYQLNDCLKKNGVSAAPGFEIFGVDLHGINGAMVADWIIGNWVEIHD